jgi:hypothetical protein
MTFFDIKNKIDNLMYDCFNLISETLYLFKFSTRKLIKKNKKYFDIHKNKRCFIIGTGPSISLLSSEEITGLENEHVFAVNSFFKIKQLKKIKPRYYALIDDVFWRQTWVFDYKDILKHYKDVDFKFITDYRSKKIIDELEFSDNTIFIHAKRFPTSNISFDIARNLPIGINVVTSCIQSALYMGYKEIYLLGCDYNTFATNVDEHSYDDADELYEIKDRLGMLLSFFSQATRIHYLIRDLSRKKNVSIINLTPNSLLDSYPKKNLSDIL